jgi:hypothetical protein
MIKVSQGGMLIKVIKENASGELVSPEAFSLISPLFSRTSIRSSAGT